MPREKRIETIKKKSKIIKAILSIVGLLVFATVVYTGVSLYSIINTDIQTGEPEYALNVHSIIDPNDDTIDYKMNVTITNNGFFSIKYVYVNITMYIENSTDNLLLPWGSKIGEMIESFPEIEKGQSYQKELVLEIPTDVGLGVGFLTQDAWIEYRFKIDTQVTYFPISVNGSIYQFYDHTNL
ncbi:MAG: hypothetical protein ACTSRZ_19820 [Promethearchaeota archaeon]